MLYKKLQPINKPIRQKRQYGRMTSIIACVLIITMGSSFIISDLNGWNLFAMMNPAPFDSPTPPSWGPPGLPAWHNPYQHRPFGRVHDFGTFVFGDMRVGFGNNNWQGLSHGESGIAVRGDLSFYRDRDYLDFGKAHEPFNAQLPHSHPIPRMLVGGNLSAGVTGGSATYASILLHGGDILISSNSNITGLSRISVAIGDVGYSYGEVGWTFVGDFSAVTRSPNVNNFFNDAYTSLNALNQRLADPSGMPWRVRVSEGNYRDARVHRSNYPYNYYEPFVWPADGWGNYDVLIYDLVIDYSVSGDYGVIRTPSITFPSGFDRLIVFNVPNTTVPVRFDMDTDITNSVTPIQGSREHALGRAFGDKIMWNFHGNSEIIHSRVSGGGGYAIIGGILAPNSVFTANQGGYVKGPFVVRDFIHAGNGFEVHTPIVPPSFVPGEVPPETPDPGTTPPPTSPQPTTPPPTELPTTTVPEPTTAQPTTEPPTEPPTDAPTTAVPTTAQPTTEPPTEAPTTEPTTEPVTETPTDAPTTAVPTTAQPTTVAPTTIPFIPPIIETPTTTAPSTTAPTTASTTPVPTTVSPTFELPTVVIESTPPDITDPTTAVHTPPEIAVPTPPLEMTTTTAPATEPPTTEPMTDELGFAIIGEGGREEIADTIEDGLQVGDIPPRENPQTSAGHLPVVYMLYGLGLAVVVSSVGLIVLHKRHLWRLRVHRALVARRSRMEELGIRDYNEE
ncbi:MAG: hypothetical protein FWE33_00695 [Defluviitaleaceae bacterium]|nr:hypothetical protein [Defluviitaleaceae bacterium]